jgi:hypothetical protein
LQRELDAVTDAAGSHLLPHLLEPTGLDQSRSPGSDRVLTSANLPVDQRIEILGQLVVQVTIEARPGR